MPLAATGQVVDKVMDCNASHEQGKAAYSQREDDTLEADYMADRELDILDYRRQDRAVVHWKGNYVVLEADGDEVSR